MKKMKTTLGIRIGLCVLMLTCCAVQFIFLRSSNARKDTTPPQLDIVDGEMEYTEGEDRRVLLEGVSANDGVDGDVTDSIRIRSMHYSDDTDTAIVTYVAKDSSNNIGVINRKVRVHREELDEESSDEGGYDEENNDGEYVED